MKYFNSSYSYFNKFRPVYTYDRSSTRPSTLPLRLIIAPE
jgi:hypothetical protein